MMAKILVSSLSLLALISLLKSCAATQYNIYDDYLAISKDIDIAGSFFHRGVRSALIKLEISDSSTMAQIREQLEAAPKEDYWVCNSLNLLVKYETPSIADDLVPVLRSILAQIRLAKKGDKLEVVGRNLLGKIVAPKLRQRASWLREHYTKLYSDLVNELDAFFAAGLKVKQTKPNWEQELEIKLKSTDFVGTKLDVGKMIELVRGDERQESWRGPLYFFMSFMTKKCSEMVGFIERFNIYNLDAVLHEQETLSTSRENRMNDYLRLCYDWVSIDDMKRQDIVQSLWKQLNSG